MHTFDDLESSERIMPNYAWMCDDGFHVQLDFDSANVGHIDALHFQMSSNRLYPFRISGIWSSSMYMFCPPTHQKNFIVFFLSVCTAVRIYTKKKQENQLVWKIIRKQTCKFIDNIRIKIVTDSEMFWIGLYEIHIDTHTHTMKNSKQESAWKVANKK